LREKEKKLRKNARGWESDKKKLEIALKNKKNKR